MSVYSIIKKPVVTEKSQKAELNGVYTVIVDQSATKVDVRSAFETLYGVEVDKVNIIKIRRKIRVAGRGGAAIKRKEQVKALVTLAKGSRLGDFQKIIAEKK